MIQKRLNTFETNSSGTHAFSCAFEETLISQMLRFFLTGTNFIDLIYNNNETPDVIDKNYIFNLILGDEIGYSGDEDIGYYRNWYCSDKMVKNISDFIKQNIKPIWDDIDDEFYDFVEYLMDVESFKIKTYGGLPLYSITENDVTIHILLNSFDDGYASYMVWFNEISQVEFDKIKNSFN